MITETQARAQFLQLMGTSTPEALQEAWSSIQKSHGDGSNSVSLAEWMDSPDSGGDSDQPGEPLLVRAILAQDPLMASFLLDQGASPNARSSSGQAALSLLAALLEAIFDRDLRKLLAAQSFLFARSHAQGSLVPAQSQALAINMVRKGASFDFDFGESSFFMLAVNTGLAALAVEMIEKGAFRGIPQCEAAAIARRAVVAYPAWRLESIPDFSRAADRQKFWRLFVAQYGVDPLLEFGDSGIDENCAFLLAARNGRAADFENFVEFGVNTDACDAKGKGWRAKLLDMQRVIDWSKGNGSSGSADHFKDTEAGVLQIWAFMAAREGAEIQAALPAADTSSDSENSAAVGLDRKSSRL